MSATPLPAIKIFRPGTFTDVGGETVTFSQADLAGMVAAYNSKKDPSPIVIGHPATDDPAYGWIDSLALEGDYVVAKPSFVAPAFAEAVRAKQYAKVSASFYPPWSSANPVPGRYYLKHLGFLGAAAPAVKGLGTVSFSAASAMPSFTVVVGDPMSNSGAALALRAQQIRTVQPTLSFSEARERARIEIVIADLAVQSHDPAARSRTMNLARAIKLQADSPGLSRHAAIERAARDAALAKLAADAGDPAAKAKVMRVITAQKMQQATLGLSFSVKRRANGTPYRR